MVFALIRKCILYGTKRSLQIHLCKKKDILGPGSLPVSMLMVENLSCSHNVIPGHSSCSELNIMKITKYTFLSENTRCLP